MKTLKSLATAAAMLAVLGAMGCGGAGGEPACMAPTRPLEYGAACNADTDCQSQLCKDSHGGGDDFRCTKSCTNSTGADQLDATCPGLDSTGAGTCRAAGWCKVFTGTCGVTPAQALACCQ